jgi:glyoxylase-like metal-dependent hydrolase (beta-lactamase superfamily II)|tara:strand:- start:19962 stop:20963 length:1002 start_codon:yes stop_codon:yes gene_type:complete
LSIPYVTDIDPKYGEVVQVTSGIRRVVANNPGRFTFTGTGTYIVGHGQVAVIDPGPENEEHVAAILSAVSGEEITHIIATHTHRDHSPASRALQTSTGAPILGFSSHPTVSEESALLAKPTTWDTLYPTEEEIEELRKSMPDSSNDNEDHEQDEPGDMAFSPDIEIGHGDVITGGTWTLEVLHTPGHISNHLCFGYKEEQSLFSGDHVMGWSTSVIPEPEGSMNDYMQSLAMLLDRKDRFFYPTHGPRIPDPIKFTSALIDHRINRENQIFDSLTLGSKTIPELVTEMYVETPHILHMAAGQSVFSHLIHMVEKNIVKTDGTPSADGIFELVR